METSTNVGTYGDDPTAYHIFCAHVHDQALMGFSGTACPLCSYEYQFFFALVVELFELVELVCFVLTCSLAVRSSVLSDEQHRKQMLKAKKQ